MESFPLLVKPIFSLSSYFSVQRANISSCKDVMDSQWSGFMLVSASILKPNTHTHTVSQWWLNPGKWGHDIRNITRYSIFKTRLHLCSDAPLRVSTRSVILMPLTWISETYRKLHSYLSHKSQCLSGRHQCPDWTCIRLSNTAEKHREKERVRKEKPCGCPAESHCDL